MKNNRPHQIYNKNKPKIDFLKVIFDNLKNIWERVKKLDKNIKRCILKWSSYVTFSIKGRKSPGLMSPSTRRKIMENSVPATLGEAGEAQKLTIPRIPEYTEGQQLSGWDWFYRIGGAIFFILFLAFLTACSGGGSAPTFTATPTGVAVGATTPPETPPTVTPPTTPVVTPTVVTATALCASGPAVSQAAANARVPGDCPALPASAFAATSVAAGSGTLSLTVSGLPLGFVGGFIAAGTATTTVQTVWGVVPGVTGVGIATVRAGSLTPTFATTYTGQLVMDFVGAPSASKTVTFTTGADPMMVDFLNQVKRLIVPQGQQRNVPATELPASVTKVTDSGFLDGVVNGTVMLIDTGMKMTGNPTVADRTRDLVASIYRQNGNYYIKMLFKDTLTAATTDDRLIVALTGFTFDRAQGASDRLFVRAFNISLGQNECGNIVWVDPTSGFSAGFASRQSTGCPIWN